MTLHFHDVSHYQINYQPDGPTICKATEGTGTDSSYARTKQRTAAGGWPFAGYHYLDPGSIAAQAAHAYAVIGKTPAMLDVERSKGGNASWAESKAFITAYRKLGGVLHLAYIPRWYWRDVWLRPDLTWLTANNVALISSQYITYSDTGPGWSPYGGVTPSIWQYTSTPIDTNAFKGTQDQLGHLFAYGLTAAPRPPEAPAGGDEDMAVMRFSFAGDVPGRPADVNDRVHLTDGVRYRILPDNTDWPHALMVSAGAGPIVVVNAAAIGGADYATAVAVLCGTLDPGEGSGAGLVAHVHDGGQTGPAEATL